MMIVICIILALFGTTMAIFLNRALSRISHYERWVEEFLQRLELAYVELKKIDASGHFESDDEVGFFFKSLKEIMNRLFEMGVLSEEEIKTLYEKQEPKITAEELQKVISERSRRKTVATSVATISKETP